MSHDQNMKQCGFFSQFTVGMFGLEGKQRQEMQICQRSG